MGACPGGLSSSEPTAWGFGAVWEQGVIRKPGAEMGKVLITATARGGEQLGAAMGCREQRVGVL